MSLGEAILAIINFLIYPTWHLVVVYTIIFVIIVYTMLKEWGFLK